MVLDIIIIMHNVCSILSIDFIQQVQSFYNLQQKVSYQKRFSKPSRKRPSASWKTRSSFASIAGNPVGMKTFHFENDSLKRTECSPMFPGKTQNSFAFVVANSSGTKMFRF